MWRIFFILSYYCNGFWSRKKFSVILCGIQVNLYLPSILQKFCFFPQSCNLLNSKPIPPWNLFKKMTNWQKRIISQKEETLKLIKVSLHFCFDEFPSKKRKKNFRIQKEKLNFRVYLLVVIDWKFIGVAVWFQRTFYHENIME